MKLDIIQWLLSLIGITVALVGYFIGALSPDFALVISGCFALLGIASIY